MKKTPVISTTILILIMTFMEMSWLPAALFVDVNLADVEPFYFVLMVNFAIAIALCFLWKLTLGKNWEFGLTTKGLWCDLKFYGWSGVMVTVFVTLGFCLGLAPFDYKPSFWKVFIEGFVYYLGVGIMEELYLRGLLQNLLVKLFGSNKDGKMHAILIISFVFGIGHIFGAMNQPPVVILCKVIWAIALGLYFGGLYAETKNLWLVIILHMVIDWCGVPFCFTTQSTYPMISLCICVPLFVMLGVHGILTAGMKKGIME